MKIPQPDRDGFSSFPPASFCLSSHPPGTWVRTGRAGASLPDLACTGVPKHVDWGGGVVTPRSEDPLPWRDLHHKHEKQSYTRQP